MYMNITTQLIKKVCKSNNTITNSREVRFTIQLPDRYFEMIGYRKCNITRLTGNDGFLISEFHESLDDNKNVKPYIISTTRNLTIPKKLVDEWSDLCIYNIFYDFDSKVIYLIKL